VKKCLAVLVCMLLLSTAALITVNASLRATENDVAIQTTDLLGNRIKANGLHVTSGMGTSFRQFWRTDYTVGGDSPVCQYIYGRERELPSLSADNSAFLNICIIPYGTSSYVGDVNTDQYGYPNWSLAVEDVASRTATGETHRETVTLSDYYDVLPLGVEFFVASKGTPYYVVNTDRLTEQLNAQFRISTPADLMCQIAVTRSADGTVKTVEISTESFVEQGTRLPMAVAATGSKVYFAVTDTSLLSNGDAVGVYCLPYTVHHESNNSVSLQLGDALEVVYPVDRASQVLDIQCSRDGQQVYVFTRESGNLMLTVLDTETNTVTQRLLMSEQIETVEGVYVEGVYIADDFLAVSCAGTAQVPHTLVLLTRKGDTFEKAFAVEDQYAQSTGANTCQAVDTFYANFSDYATTSMAYAAGRLAVLATDECGVSVAVYDAAGLQYLGYDRLKIIGESPLASSENTLWPLELKAAWQT
jgi:hypothetical protein